jgi:UDP-galactose transporter B1
LRLHPTLLQPLVLYALTGALGQLFIFETLERYGSLTLVMVTVTRKLFTMMVSRRAILVDGKLRN